MYLPLIINNYKYNNKNTIIKMNNLIATIKANPKIVLIKRGL
jgi:hypothetical protein